jgi:hypothetical protein
MDVPGKRNDAVIARHDELSSGVLARHRLRTHSFVPHVTVGGVAAGDLAAAPEATAARSTPVTATVEVLPVHAIEPDGTRPVLFEVPLG